MNGLVCCWCAYHKNKEEGHKDELCIMFHKPENHVEHMKNKHDPKSKHRITAHESREIDRALSGKQLQAKSINTDLKMFMVDSWPK